jgi:hypothetical protein
MASSGFLWVYGLLVGLKKAFLTDLIQTCFKDSLPILVNGDFNIIRSPQERNNDKYDDRWPFLFNAVIDGLDLRELQLSNRRFIWINSRKITTYEMLD